ncbi:MAG: hypothetical protein VB138_11705 [Burkholderia sp.]
MPRVRSLLAVSLSAALALPPGSHAQSPRPAQAAQVTQAAPSPVAAGSPTAGATRLPGMLDGISTAPAIPDEIAPGVFGT